MKRSVRLGGHRQHVHRERHPPGAELASIARGIWIQVRSHAPEIAIDDADE
ncbi:MAG: hypothetical protein ACYC24_02095 [Desulfobacteria bacterium]